MRLPLKSCKVSATLAALAVVSAASIPARAQGTRIGKLVDPHAWIDKMPPGPPNILASGKITAPTPCYDALAQFAGMDQSNPPIYLVKVTLQQRRGRCIQRPTNVSFFYVRSNYTDGSTKMRLFSDQDSKTMSIEVVY